MSNTPEDIATMTPMLRQYYELKEKAPGAIMLFRMGDFYEIFGDDAELVAPKLEIVLTSRERGGDKKIPFCGVPHHSAKSYWLKLLSLGYKIAIAEQIEDAAVAKGLVKRDITRIYAPGCVDDLEALDQTRANFMCAVYEEPKSKVLSFAAIDTSTGEFRLGQLANLSELNRVLHLFEPRQILVRKFFVETLKASAPSFFVNYSPLIEELPEAALRDKKLQTEILEKQFAAKNLSALACGNVAGGVETIASVMAYLDSMQASKSHITNILPLVESDRVELSETAIRDLELFETARRRDGEGSLWSVVQKTLTPMGTRLLRQRLAKPMRVAERIEESQNQVEKIIARGEDALKNLRENLKHCADLERLSIRLHHKKIEPREVALIKHSLRRLSSIDQLTTKPMRDMLTFLDTFIVDAPEMLVANANVIQSGFCKDLDQKRAFATKSQDIITAYETRLRTETGIGSLKIKDHQSFGHLIEVTKTHLTKVPKNFVRRQTMVNAERFVTEELLDLSAKISNANIEASQLLAKVYAEGVEKLSKWSKPLTEFALIVARFDVAQNFAWIALRSGWVRAKISKTHELSLIESRHPVVEKSVGRHQFTANDFKIKSEQMVILVTGPNMAGKSTLMRQVAISAILNQAGGYVPATSASLPVFDQIFTRVGASDDLARGQSTFMVEMTEAAEILRKATRTSLVILDEIGRGTSTTDGLALASAILEDLATRVQCLSFFSTHYHELGITCEKFPTVRAMQTEVLTGGGKLQFTHRVIAGTCDNSYGIDVAKLAGVPEKVIARAREHLSQKAPTEPISKVQRQLFRLEDQAKVGASKSPQPQVDERLLKILHRLEQIKIHKTTPLQALNALDELKSMAATPTQKSLFSSTDFQELS